MGFPVGKTCYCHTCGKGFHYLGITRHRAAHRDRKEVCTITYTHGDTFKHDFTDKPVGHNGGPPLED